MPLSNNKNLITGSTSDRAGVTPLKEQMFLDTGGGSAANGVFVGDGSTAGGHALDVRPATTKTADYTFVRGDEALLLIMN